MGVKIQRGDIVWVDFGPVRGRCKAERHPALVVQNDRGNEYSPMTIVVPLTDERQFKHLPVQVRIGAADTGVPSKPSCIECGHVITIDADEQIDQVEGVVGHVEAPVMAQVDAALRVSLSL